MAKKQPELRIAICKVSDAVYKEDLGSDVEEKFSNSIFIQLKEIETGNIYSTHLSQKDVQAISGLNRPLNSLEMINCAAAFRSRTDPLRFFVPVDGKVISAGLIKASEELDKPQEIEKEEDIEILEEEPIIEKKIPKFTMKNKLNKEKENK
jgi:hypothetical protein